MSEISLVNDLPPDVEYGSRSPQRKLMHERGLLKKKLSKRNRNISKTDKRSITVSDSRAENKKFEINQ